MSNATDVIVQTSPQAEPARTSIARRQWRKFARNPIGVIALVILLGILATALLAPVLAPHDPDAIALSLRLRPPVGQERYVAGYFLGTDKVGRDILSRLIYGSRTALLVAFSSVILSLGIGTIVGLLAGYFRGKVDAVISIVIDIFMAFPFILLALAVVAVLGPGLWKLVAVIGITTWTDFARVVRSETLAIREKDYVAAANALGGKHLRILIRHVLPNVVSSVIVLSTLAVARTILLESSLSYLGMGVPPQIPDWGYMLADSKENILSHSWLAIFPSLAILLTVLSVNLVGDRLRDVLDPKID
jgi:ABC-type dipeptide/oligopeptide/nickel transport system permease subunit